MKNSKSIRLILIAGLGLLFFSCASSAKPVAAPQKKTAPEWVLTPPAGTAENEFFVGSSSDAGGDAAKAEEQAVYSLIAEITRYIGVKVTAETTSTAKAALDSFQAQVTQQIKQEAGARVVGLRVTDKFLDKDGTRVTVYILAEYDRKELEKEKARIAAVFQEQVDAVALPEAQGKRFEQSGNLFGAIKSYIEAAAAASTSKVDNAEIKFERNINNAKRVVSRIGLVPLTKEVSGMIGSPLPEPFRLKVVDGQGEGDFGVEAADIQVSYKEMRTGGRVGIRTAGLKSDSGGIVSFEHPVPSFVGTETLSMVLDLSAFLTPLDNVPRAFQPAVNGLRDLIVSKRADFSYTVDSRAKKVPTGIVILDMDTAGNPTGNSLTSSGLLEALSADGFQVRTLTYDPVMLKGVGDADIVKSVQSSFGSRIERVVFGTVAIDEFEETRAGFQVRVAGTVKTAELSTGRILYSKRMFKRSLGSSSDAAISAAFRNLGLDFGNDLSRNLP